MATIKSYTDIEQSKKLAEILPLETADYCWGIDDETLQYNDSPYPCAWKDYTCKEYYIPCWSLAALIEEIPEIINFDDDESDYAFEILKEGGFYYLSYRNPLEGEKLNIEPQENFVDACVAMIEKLHELNLL